MTLHCMILLSLVRGIVADSGVAPAPNGTGQSPTIRQVNMALPVIVLVRSLAESGHVVLLIQGIRGDVGSNYPLCLEALLRGLPNSVKPANVTIVIWPDVQGRPAKVFAAHQKPDRVRAVVRASRPPADGGGGLRAGLDTCSSVLKGKSGHVLILAGGTTTLSKSMQKALSDFSKKQRVHAVVVEGPAKPFRSLISGFVIGLDYGQQAIR